MDLNDLTLGQLKEIQGMCAVKGSSEGPYKIGKNYFLRTVTHYYTGKLKAIYSDCFVLEEAAWIADTGRVFDFLRDGKVNEVEPFVSDIIVPKGSLVDMTEWTHKLFKDQK